MRVANSELPALVVAGRGPGWQLNRLARCLSPLLCCLALCGGRAADAQQAGLPPAEAAGVDPGVERAAVLVEQLGSPQFADREQATAELVQLGLPALRALERAARSPQREIRLRAERALRVVRKLDFERRLRAFSEATDASDVDLPGWSRFREAVGDEPAARSLFVAMQREEPQLMDAVAIGPGRVQTIVGLRVMRIQEQLRLRPELSVGSVAALLFATTGTGVELPEQVHQLVGSFCSYPDFRQAMRGADSEPLRRLVSVWIGQADGWAAYQGFRLAIEYDLKAGLVPAQRVVKQKGAAPHVRYQAILAIAKLGGQDDLGVVEDLLDEPATVSAMVRDGKRIEIQLRDVALGTLILATRRNPANYGLPGLRASQTDPKVIDLRTLGFADEAARDAAIAAWREHQPQPGR